MNDWPVITIITAVLNSAEHLDDAIKSVLSQDYPYTEYIIVDGGSTDGTLDIIRKYEPFLARWVSEPDRGISDAFNKGIHMASGDIIGIVSSDDYLTPGALEEVAKAYRHNPHADAVYGNAVYIEPYNKQQYVVKPDVGLKTIWRRQPLKHAAVFVARSAYETYGAFSLEYRLAMDYELILRFHRHGAKFVYIDYPLASFRTGGVSTRQPLKTAKEVRDISIRFGCSPWKAHPVYWGKCVKLLAREIIIKSGLTAAINLYRRFSRRFAHYPLNETKNIK